MGLSIVCHGGARLSSVKSERFVRIAKLSVDVKDVFLLRCCLFVVADNLCVCYSVVGLLRSGTIQSDSGRRLSNAKGATLSRSVSESRRGSFRSLDATFGLDGPTHQPEATRDHPYVT